MWFKLLLSGALAILFGYISSYIVLLTSSVDNLPGECKTWNKNYVMEQSLFLVGIMLYSFLIYYNFLISKF